MSALNKAPSARHPVTPLGVWGDRLYFLDALDQLHEVRKKNLNQFLAEVGEDT